MSTTFQASWPIIELLGRVESGATGGAAGVYAADGVPTLRSVIVPVKLLRELREAYKAETMRPTSTPTIRDALTIALECCQAATGKRRRGWDQKFVADTIEAALKQCEAAPDLLTTLRKCAAIVQDRAGSGQWGAGLSEYARCELSSQILAAIAKAEGKDNG